VFDEVNRPPDADELAERIMRTTHARLVGSYETIRVMETAGVPVDRMMPVAGGGTVDLGRGVRVSVYPSQHSCVWSQGQAGRPQKGESPFAPTSHPLVASTSPPRFP